MIELGSLALSSNSTSLVPNFTANLSNLSAYVRCVNNLPVLTEQQERDLALDFSLNGKVESAKALVMSHLRLVVKIAKEHSGYELSQEDLIQEGNLGLMVAVKKFDPNRGVRLAAYAAIWIRSEIQEYILNNWRLVKIGSAKGLRKLFFNLRRLQKELHGKSRLEQRAEIAKLLGVGEAEVERAIGWFSGGEVKLVGKADQAMDDDSIAIADYLPADDSGRPEEVVGRNRKESLLPLALQNALSCLSDRELSVVKARFLQEPPATLNELSLELGVSLERVRQIEVAGLKKLKAAAPGLRDYID